MQCRRIVSEKQRRSRPKMGLPCGAGRFSAATSSLVLDVARLRHRPRSSSRSKTASARWSPYSLPGPKMGSVGMTPRFPCKTDTWWSLNFIGTKHMALERKKPSSRSRSKRTPENRLASREDQPAALRKVGASGRSQQHTFAVCVSNQDYPAALELRKLYRVINDPFARQHSLIRIIDESGEDYLYPSRYFVSVELPKAVRQTLQRIA